MLSYGCPNLRWKFWSMVQLQVKVSEGAGTPSQEANGDVLLDGVAFSQLE